MTAVIVMMYIMLSAIIGDSVIRVFEAGGAAVGCERW